jgi:hypothetical protein
LAALAEQWGASAETRAQGATQDAAGVLAEVAALALPGADTGDPSSGQPSHSSSSSSSSSGSSKRSSTLGDDGDAGTALAAAEALIKRSREPTAPD